MSSKSEKHIEKYELPSSIDGICSLIRHLLEQGHVARLELDHDDAYLRLWRWIEKGDLDEPDINWDGALRNLDNFLEYGSEDASAFQIVLDMMTLAGSNNLFGSCWTIGTGGRELLKEWLALKERGMPNTDLYRLAGIPVLELKSLPVETLILCCSKFPNADPAEISLAIKTTVDTRGSHVENIGVNDRVGDHPEEHPSAVGQLALNPRGLRSIPWKTPGKLG